MPAVRTEFSSLGQRTGIRLDSGIVDGSVVSIHYDPMLAKVISYAPTRRQSALVLADALARAQLHGLRTNRELLVNVLRHPAFLDGATDTAFFDTHGLAQLSAPLADDADDPVVGDRRRACRRRTQSRDGDGVRLDSQWLAQPSVGISGQDLPPTTPASSTGSNIASPERDWLCRRRARAARLGDPDEVVLADAGGVACNFAVQRHDGPDIYVDSARGPVHLAALPRFPEPGSAVEKGSLVAPMPGNVIRLGAAVGDTVTAGQPLIWLEAMKMEHTITAPADGVLAELNVDTGQQVEVGAVLAGWSRPNVPEEGDPQ